MASRDGLDFDSKDESARGDKAKGPKTGWEYHAIFVDGKVIAEYYLCLLINRVS